MNIHDKLLNHINNDEFPEYESLLSQNKNLNFSGKDENNILLQCLEKDKLNFFETFIKNKSSEIFNFNFENMVEEILKQNKINYTKCIFQLVNINLYINLKSIIDISIKHNNYKLLEYLIENNLYKLEYYDYISIIKLLIKIENTDTCKLMIESIKKNKNKIEMISDLENNFYINDLFKCNDEIFQLVVDLILFLKEDYLTDFNYKNEIYKINSTTSKNNFNITKFNYIYHKLSHKEHLTSFKNISIINCLYLDNLELLNDLIEKFSMSNHKLLEIIKKYKNVINRRNLIELLINKFPINVSYYLFKKYKDDILSTNINNLILSSIENNNYLILNDLDIDIIKKINVKKIETNILENHLEEVYIINETMDVLFNKFKLIDNNKFIIDYAKLLIDNNNKEYFVNLLDIINKCEIKYIQNFEKKIKNYILSNIIQIRLEDGDIYDWYYIEWLDIKLENIDLINNAKNIIINNVFKYMPNIHFIYWHISGQKTILDDEMINSLLIKAHSGFPTQELTQLNIDNLEYDNVLVELIKNILKKDEKDLEKDRFMFSLYSFDYKKIVKVENIDNEMIELFNKVYKEKHIISNLLKYMHKFSSEKIIYLLNKVKKLKINIGTIKFMIQNIIHNKDYYLMEKLLDNFNKKDTKNYLDKLLKESIKSSNIIMFEWSYNKLILYDKFKDEFQKMIFKLNYFNVWNTELLPQDVFNFYMKISNYFNEENKDILYEKILDLFCDCKLIVEEFLKNIDYASFSDGRKYNFFKNMINYINRENIEKCLSIINISDEDYNIISEYNINENKDEELFNCLEYNLLYFHNIELIKVLMNKGIKFKFGIEILKGLFETKNFNRSNNEEINNTTILDVIKYLSEIDLYKIDIELINLFLYNYKIIKYKISLDDIKYLINKYDIKINNDSYLLSASTLTKDIFDYFMEIEKIDIKKDDELLFLRVCLNNDVEFAKYLLELDPEINISIDDDNIFSQCCNDGGLEIVKWLYGVIPEMNYKTKYEYSICGACYYGNLEVAKWLKENIEDLDLKVDNDYCMVSAVTNGYYDVVNWILEMEPDRYIIEWDNENNIKTFTINKKLIIEESKKVETIIECPICYESKTKIITCCDHQFCYNCFNEYFKKNTNICCPYCRKENITLYNIETT